MCGITGFWTPSGLDRDSSEQLRRMTDALRHRGPDDAGAWLDPSAGVALGHRRLSIIDLSPEGHQPMVSASGRYVIVYNGEIYNFRGLRAEEERAGVRFRGHSDTEVLLAAIERRGVEAAVCSAAGMFAFALWDRESRRLHLVRDRIGEKPLYYGWVGGTLLFGSELKSLRAHRSWRADIDRDALALFMRFAYVPAPRSIYSGMAKVPQASIVTVAAEGTVETNEYWRLADVIRRGRETPLDGSEEEVVSTVERRLSETIGEQMVSDVPLGAFLSGGIDSSTIVALMQGQSSRPVRTFTIGFHEAGYNEAESAKAVARHLGTDHTELYVTPEEALAVIPRLPTIYDEPFGDSSQIPTFLVAEMARRHVTVALSGDGGDEMFGGYNRYFLGRQIWRGLAPVPMWFRRAGASAIRSVRPETWQTVLGTAQGLLPRRARLAHVGDRIHKLADVLAVPSSRLMYRKLASHWAEPESLVVGGTDRDVLTGAGTGLPADLSFVEWMMAVDTRTYLADDIMVKVDRAGMAVSLESRAPFLDHRIVELAWRAPFRSKVRGQEGKWVVRRILARYVPPALTNRPKMGFGLPIDKWLRGPLKRWASDLLESGRLKREGYLAPEPVVRKWQEHLTGRRNWQYQLWDVLMFQAWLQAQ